MTETAFTDPAASVHGEAVVHLHPARLSSRGNPIPGFIEVPTHERLSADDARRLSAKLHDAAEALKRWDDELLPVLAREAEINERFLGGTQ